MALPGTMTKEEKDFLVREIKRSERWGKLTFGELMDTLDEQQDEIERLRSEIEMRGRQAQSNCGHYGRQHHTGGWTCPACGASGSASPIG